MNRQAEGREISQGLTAVNSCFMNETQLAKDGRAADSENTKLSGIREWGNGVILKVSLCLDNDLFCLGKLISKVGEVQQMAATVAGLICWMDFE